MEFLFFVILIDVPKPKSVKFESSDITEFEFSKGNRQIKKKVCGLNQVVFANVKFSDAGCSDFSVRIVKNQRELLIGAAIESAKLSGRLYKLGWVLFSGGHHIYDRGRNHHSDQQARWEGQVVTVRVDVARKQIVYLVDGVPIGLPHTMNISDDEIQKLRPAEQTYNVGDILEIV